MTTAAVFGVVQPGGGWHATYVREEGQPERLGWMLLDQVARRRGNLEATWRVLSRAPAGFEDAQGTLFEPDDAAAYFRTGRSEPPLLCDTDAFVRTNVSFWYLFDLEARTLSIRTREDGFREVRERITFDDEGYAHFATAPSGPLDWRNRRRHYGDDEPGRAAVQLLWRLLRPVVGPRMWLTFDVEATPALVPVGLVVPYRLHLVDEPNADGSWEPQPTIRDSFEDEEFVLASRRALRDTSRCELVLETALEAIGECAGQRKVPVVRHPGAEVERRRGRWHPGVPDLFPFRYLDLELDEETLRETVKNHVRDSFED